jgi:hypothetical protein
MISGVEKLIAVTSAIGKRARAAKKKNMETTPISPRTTWPNGREVFIAVQISRRQA